MSWQLRSCPRCRGDLILSRDTDYPDVLSMSCLQCGWESSHVSPLPRAAVPDPPPDPHPQEIRAEALRNSACYLVLDVGQTPRVAAAVLQVSRRTVQRGVRFRRSGREGYAANVSSA